MRREMRSLATKFTNYQQNRLTVRVVPFQNERFVDRNVHLHYNAQLERLSVARKLY